MSRKNQAGRICSGLGVTSRCYGGSKHSGASMIVFRSRGALFGEYWFDDESPPPDCDVDVLAFRQRSSPVAASHCAPSLTLVSELTVGADELFVRFGKTCREKIMRADRRDGLRMELTTDARSPLQNFCDFYDAFARQKGLRPADRGWLEAACVANRLALATVWRGDEPLVRHGYVVGSNTVRMHCSASLFRAQDKEYRALTARANRWLHWRSMMYFKERGATLYDWGGLFEDESTAERVGINNFKRDFGGRPARRFDCLVARSARGHLRVGMRRLGDSWRRCQARVATLRSPPPARATAAVSSAKPEAAPSVDA
jgi:Acetyltransferase (GNAT) domain